MLQSLGGKAIAPVIFCLCVLVLLRLFIGSPPGKRQPPAPIARTFLTRREQAMLNVLEQVLPHCRIHAQVAMGALLDAPRILGRQRHIADRNALSQKIVDFVVQDRANGGILALIEVDDYTHVPARDRARDAMTARAGYRTIRISALTRPYPDAVRGAVADLLPAAAAAPVAA